MRQPDNLPAFCRVHRNGRPLIGRIGRLSTDTDQPVAHTDHPLARVMDGRPRTEVGALNGGSARVLHELPDHTA